MTESKEFLISQIVEEAKRERVELSETERKMLYFSETDSLPDIAEVNEAFDRDHDRAEYEKKIVHLIRNLRARFKAPEADAWNHAVGSLRTGDHYLLVMIDEACGRERPQGDLAKLIGTAVAIVAILLGLLYFFGGR